MNYSITERTRVDAATMIVKMLADDATGFSQAQERMAAEGAAPGSMIDVAEDKTIYRLSNSGEWLEYLTY